MMIVLFIVLARNKLRIPLEGTYSTDDDHSGTLDKEEFKQVMGELQLSRSQV